MKSRTIILLALLLGGAALIVVSSRHGTSPKEVAVGLPAPAFSAVDSRNGRLLTPADLRDKVVLVNFWASWCQPCKDEMPSLDALYKEMMQNDSFVMVTLLYKDSPSDALAYLKALGFSFPVFDDKDSIAARDFGVTGVPETYLIDKKGILKQRVIGGADWNSPEAKSLITALLKE